jgi:GDP-L-fucose synthase
MASTKKNFWEDKTVLVTGGTGFLGTHVVQQLKKRNPKKIIAPSSKEYDLTKKRNITRIVKGIDVVIHLAAKVGGIGYNMVNPGSMFYENIFMGVNLMEESRKASVKKFVGIGTVCAYPKFAKIPFREDDLWNGYPEEINAPYGLAKKMLLVQGQAYKKQYGFNSIHLIPVNLYGPGDKFHPEISHVMPALIRKFEEARTLGKKEVEIWGTGKATREFLYVEDCAEGILLATERYEKTDPVNLGSGEETSIKQLAKIISTLCDYKGKIVFNTEMPDGQPRRKLDTSKAKKEFGFSANTPLMQGIKTTIEWYRTNVHE